MNMEYILCAANHYDDGKVYVHQPINIISGYVICGRRHHNIINTLGQVFGLKTADNCEQGFITNTDRFVGRREANEIALKSGQIKNKKSHSGQQLYSEDLY